jgi:hypothetical protein
MGRACGLSYEDVIADAERPRSKACRFRSPVQRRSSGQRTPPALRTPSTAPSWRVSVQAETGDRDDSTGRPLRSAHASTDMAAPPGFDGRASPARP